MREPKASISSRGRQRPAELESVIRQRSSLSSLDMTRADSAAAPIGFGGSASGAQSASNATRGTSPSTRDFLSSFSLLAATATHNGSTAVTPTDLGLQLATGSSAASNTHKPDGVRRDVDLIPLDPAQQREPEYVKYLEDLVDCLRAENKQMKKKLRIMEEKLQPPPGPSSSAPPHVAPASPGSEYPGTQHAAAEPSMSNEIPPIYRCGLPRWKRAALDWSVGDPARNLVVPLKDWPTKLPLSKGKRLWGTRKTIGEAYIACGQNDAKFIETYPAAAQDRMRKLIKQIRLR